MAFDDCPPFLSPVYAHTSPPRHPDGNAPVHPVPESSHFPWAGVSHRLPAGWCCVAGGWKVRMGVPACSGGPSPFRGTWQEQTVAREVVGRLRVIPQAQGWLAPWDLLGPGTWCQGGPKSKGGATAPCFSALPGFPQMLAQDGRGKLWIPGFEGNPGSLVLGH